jgi:UDP-glucose 4-epimerase
MEHVDKKILITGGAGFIGSELTRLALLSGCQVVVVDNLVNGKRENLDQVLGDRCVLMVDDIRNQDQIQALLTGVDVVFHLACLGVRHSIHSPGENHEVNATATLKLLDKAQRAGVTRFVYVSSSEVYGTAQWAPMSEDHPTYPMTVYGASKLAGECYTRAYHRTYGYNTVVVRPFNTYGPRCHHEGDSGEVIPKFMLRCLANLPMVIFGDGEQTRDMTYVSDTARGILLAGFADGVVGETLNLGSGSEVSINELARQVAIVTDKPGAPVIHDAPRPGDVSRLYSDSRKAQALLDYQPQVALTDGLRMLKDWYFSLGASDEHPKATGELLARELLKNEIIRNWERR